MKTLYAGIFIIDMVDWMVLATSDSKHPNDYKAVGGMGLTDETPKKIAIREASEEGRVQVTDLTLVLVEKNEGYGNEHIRYFFLADKVDGSLDKGASWEVEEKNAMGYVVEKLTTRWVPIRQFADRLFYKQYPAFGAVLSKLVERNPSLLNSRNFCQLLQKFPEPENTGVEGVVVD